MTALKNMLVTLFGGFLGLNSSSPERTTGTIRSDRRDRALHPILAAEVSRPEKIVDARPLFTATFTPKIRGDGTFNKGTFRSRVGNRCVARVVAELGGGRYLLRRGKKGGTFERTLVMA